ncbi:TraX family protein [Enterococcus sp. AZ109]|uniref:TraX family protein n=1 Tax=Enterococcus sp. AZ109 TaxID=2774634 RepID=UPI003F1FAD48
MNTFKLKIIALILMVVDHVGLYFDSMPTWFGWLGRGSYPIFLFCMVWGYHFTRDRKKYLLRLYVMSLFMTAFGYLVDSCFVTESGYGNHNIFLPMFLVGLLISTIEIFRKDRKKGAIILAGLFFVQMLYYIIPNIVPFAGNLSGDVLTGIIPNLVLNEYGFNFVALGVLMYFLKEKKDLLCVVYILFCISQFSGEMINTGSATQWMMIIALPFMLQYNKEKGPSLKYFFYIFYPAHTFVLFYLANFIFNR